LPADTFDLDSDTNVAEPLPFDQRGPGFIRRFGTVDIGSPCGASQKSVSRSATVPPPSSEGDSGTTNSRLRHHSPPATPLSDVNMTYTVSGAAVNGTDFVGGTLLDRHGHRHQWQMPPPPVTIPVSGDTASRTSSEAFTVTLASSGQRLRRLWAHPPRARSPMTIPRQRDNQPSRRSGRSLPALAVRSSFTCRCSARR